MTARDRLRAALRGERWGQRVPWSPLIDGYFLSSLPAGTDALEAARRIGADAMVRHVLSWSSEILHRREPALEAELLRSGSCTYQAAGVTVTTTRRETEGRTVIRRVCALNGRKIEERVAFTATSPYIPFPLEYPIKTVADIELYASMIRRDSYEARYAEFAAEDARVGDAGLATDSGRTSPIQELVQHLIGVEAFYTRFLPDHRGETEELMRLIHQKNLEAYEVMAGSPAEVIIDYENTSSTLMSPELYARYCRPCIDDYADLVHRSGKMLLTHRCGKLKAFLGLMAEGRDDGISDVSPPPTGDVELWEARASLPGKVVTGGLDATVLSARSPEPARRSAERIIERCQGAPGVIVGSGDAVPQNAGMENLLAVTRLVEEYEGGAP